MTNTPGPFAQELARTPEAMSELSISTYYRYVRADYPHQIAWLKRYPNLLRALLAETEREQAVSTSDN